MIHWGINALNHGSSLAIFDSGLRRYEFFPEDTPTLPAGLNAWEWPDRVYWYEQPWLKKTRQLYAGQYKTAFDLSVLPSRYLKSIGLEKVPVTYTPHHASHAASGYYTSPFNHCAVVVLDAIGEWECASIWEGNHNELKKVWSRSYPNSLGLFYSAFTKLINLQPIKQEFLLQQMAEQGDPWRYFSDVCKYVDINMNHCENMHRGINDWPYPIETLQDQCDIAAAVQHVFECQVASIMNTAKKLTKADSLVYMGGCAMNSAANKRVVEPRFEYIWSLPQPGDPSSALGAVLYHTKNRVWDYEWGTVKHIDIKI